MTARGPRWEAQQQIPRPKTYQPLKPCKQCNTSERRVDNGNCCQCERVKMRAFMKGRYRKDPIFRQITLASQKNKRLTDPQFRLRERIYQVTYGALRYGKHRRLIIGCTGAELRRWFEQQFHSGMTWENYGKLWSSDHIKPLSSFDLTNQDQFYAACHYTNTRPMLDSENKSRRTRYRNITRPT